MLIDINKGFLDIARSSNIRVKELVIDHSDILKSKLKKECDLVFSIFAYHHVKDDEKKKYIEQIKSCLKETGILILTEIYLKDKQECIDYYKRLSKSIPNKDYIQGLDEFLQQTAKSTDFEFKVEKEFADNNSKKKVLPNSRKYLYGLMIVRKK
ncbi:methyltransferase domain-containing protein [Candidatus Pacearchaeota archaeon]|nr:methyltransferase domain-containing protein [Candidatus Pacearchaeota archaeon]